MPYVKRSRFIYFNPILSNIWPFVVIKIKNDFSFVESFSISLTFTAKETSFSPENNEFPMSGTRWMRNNLPFSADS